MQVLQSLQDFPTIFNFYKLLLNIRKFDPRTFVPIGEHAASFRSYLGVMAKYHVPIVATCWDDVPQVDKNLLSHDIYDNWDIPNDERKRMKILSHIAVRWRDFKARMTRQYHDLVDSPSPVRAVGGVIGLRDYFGPKPRSIEAVTQEIVNSIRQQVYHPEKQPIAQPLNQAREEPKDHDVISILTSRLNKLRKGPNDSWACGYYIMSWIKAIIREEIRGEWTKRFNTTSSMSTSVINTIKED
ncbi:hypothetical protein LR48_Vigan11g046700 [Vigna angularis]|uniref:Ubiquitin-like protease family profile domain-containing protein n=1 Tax=Phaseolus angularis TaxID=3914 RepID=A0A0L9VRQ2_PHAAN|nr:hypothetical protein LR48_Vigan11g046700 [Vigna angularis]